MKHKTDKPGILVSAAIRADVAQYNAQRHWALYRKTKDGLLVWRMYQEFRKAGVPVPEAIMRKLDQFAERLASAGSADEVAEALQMKQKRGGAAGATKTRGAERSRDIVEAVLNAIRFGGKNPTKAYAEIAERFGTTNKYVKNLYTRWMRASNKRNLLQDLWRPATTKK